jgi:ATP-dependent DNA helicase RecG
MTTTSEQIDLWRQAPSEHQRLEFKEAKNQFDTRKLSEYCVALANEGGGVLLLGVVDRPPRAVVGTQAFPDTVQAAEKLFRTVGFRVDIDAVAHPDGRVVIFHIPSRPRGTAYHFDGKYLMRAGEALMPMSEDQLRRIFAEGQPDWLEEPSRSGLDAQQVVELLDTQTFFELLRLPYPTDRNGVIERLTREKMVDESGGTFVVRRLGALTLARRLEDFPDVTRKAARLVVYSGISKLDTRLDQMFTRGYTVGFQELVRSVMTQLPRNEAIEGALRRELKLVPDVVIRELIANALIHQDFLMGGASVMIEVYSDRVEISSPGEPLVPIERFIDGYQSRNERLADLMRRVGICEEKSSGVDRVVQAAEAYHLPAPDFRSGFRRTSAIIYGQKPFDEMDRNDRVRACYQHCALKWVTRQPMTNQSLRARFRLGEDKAAIASQVIAATIYAKLIKLDESVRGSRKFARYQPFWA